MIAVSATAVGIPFDLTMPTLNDWLPNSVGWIVAVAIVGSVTTLVAMLGYSQVARVANIAAPWMILVFIAWFCNMAMHIGIAGFQLAGVRFGGGQTVEDKILFGTPEWLAAVHHAAKEADRLNLEMAIFSSAGWSLTGGPWVKPQQAMKKLVWSDTLIHGSQKFTGLMPHPPYNNGPIGNLGQGSRPDQRPDPTFYQAVAVLDYPAREPTPDMASRHPNATSHAGPIDATLCFWILILS